MKNAVCEKSHAADTYHKFESRKIINLWYNNEAMYRTMRTNFMYLVR